MPKRVVIVGGGITGLACAHRLLALDPLVDVTVLEADARVGGVIRTSPFAGHAAVDEAADAFLLRVPAARNLAEEVGLGGSLTSPAVAHASVWRGRLHPLPESLLLGVPTRLGPLVRSRLISTRGKLRAGLEPFLPRTATDLDCLGAFMRKRLGNEVQEILIDPLVGSIYATDTDSFSLRGMPQLQELASEGRSLMISAQKRPRPAPGGAENPVFAAPAGGMQALTDAVHASVLRAGAKVMVNSRVSGLDHDGKDLVVRVSDEEHRCDHVVLASPARRTGEWLAHAAPNAARLLAAWEHASVVMVTLAVPRHAMPRSATGSGYLVPKTVQRFVTAVSFASQKWAHLDDGTNMVLRVSLGRDGMPLHHHSNDELLSFVLADLKWHLGVDFDSHVGNDHVRLTRWVESFPQYRPRHFERVDRVEAHLATELPNVHLAGASYRGIGIPACIEQANETARRIIERVSVR
ncbi:MAG: protoporphyrinogen oxidase [Actinobacteria bacterium]|nr:protoporphyrinogen oxidase [Actinomycetota bacterium]